MTVAAVEVLHVTSAAFLKAASELVDAWKKLRAKFPGLPPPKLEIGLRRVPIDQVTAQDAEEATG